MICWKCKKEIQIDGVFRTTECPLCHADIRCCKACKFYAPGSHFDCKEMVSEPVADKEKSNFCDFFMIKTDVTEDSKDSKAENARNAAAALFGEGSVKKADDADSARNAFNSLFGD